MHYDVADGVATITLDSPHNRNALSRQLVTELFDALDRAEEDEDARVVLIRSADRVFCSGADLSEAAGGGMAGGHQGAGRPAAPDRHAPQAGRRRGSPDRCAPAGSASSPPATWCICSDDVTFAFTESRLGAGAGVISLTVLPRLTSRAAADTFLTGRTFDAAEAAAMGLVTRSGARRRARRRRRRAPATSWRRPTRRDCARPRRCSRATARSDIDAQADEMAALSARLFGSDEAREAMTAFLDTARRARAQPSQRRAGPAPR